MATAAEHGKFVTGRCHGERRQDDGRRHGDISPHSVGNFFLFYLDSMFAPITKRKSCLLIKNNKKTSKFRSRSSVK